MVQEPSPLAALSSSCFSPRMPPASLSDALLPGQHQGSEPRDGGPRGRGRGLAGAAGQQAGQSARVLANLVNSGIGASTVAMPLAVLKLGVGVALAAMAVQALLGILANHILSRWAGERAAGGQPASAAMLPCQRRKAPALPRTLSPPSLAAASQLRCTASPLPLLLLCRGRATGAAPTPTTTS